jgi:diguanylate cyclase (GGDEF)-like protein
MFSRYIHQVELKKWWKWFFLLPILLFSLIAAYLCFTLSREEHASFLELYIVLGVLFLFVVCLLYGVHQYIIQPLKVLQKTTEHLITGDANQLTIDIQGPKEVIDISQKLLILVDRFKQQATELALVQEDLSQHAQLASIMGHEIRTPLNGILGMLDLLRSTTLSKHQQECVDVARKSSGLLVDFINTVLDEKTDTTIQEPNEIEKNEQEVELDLQEAKNNLRSSRLDQALRMQRYQSKDKKKCVLVVEDNHTNQLVASGMLRALGYDYALAWNGIEALELFGKTHFDLILMDCNMPEMNGYDATLRIRELEQEDGQHIPIVAMTADAQLGAMERCKEAGMDDYLLKPVLLADLRKTIQKWLTLHLQEIEELTKHLFEIRADEPSVDPVFFAGLKELLGDYIELTIKPYLEDMPLYLADFEDAAIKGDREALLVLLHVMKGASGNFGTIVLQRYLHDMETLISQEHYDAILEKLILIQEEFSIVHAILSEELVGRDIPHHLSIETELQVLVVDDDRCTRHILRTILQAQGFRVEEAGNGVQALLMLKYFRPDAIILDGIMPVMDGFTACARIQELPDGKDIPILMLTALDDSFSMKQALAVGANDYVTKPIHFLTLPQRLHRLIDASHSDRQAMHLVYNDVLTGLPNRKLFFEQLDRVIVESAKIGHEAALLFLNIKRFKHVNDTLGHAIGDRLLVAISQRIRHSIRSTDFVARIGGDEFAIIFSDIPDINAITAAAKNLVRALSAPISIDKHDIIISTCAGIAMYPQDAKEPEELLRHANTAMVQAKTDQTGIEFFSIEMERLLLDKNRLEMDLSEALAHNSFQLYYQPQADLRSGRIVGVEALIRWQHPTRGFVSPVDFIPLAEELGLIGLLGLWVMRTACYQLQEWLEKGFPPIRMAVNVSVQQLLHQEFVQQVAGVIEETGINPDYLELEITESMLMENAKDTLQILHDLRALGVRMSIDDFGTGYSSLAYLRQFPVDIIKIDRSFTLDVPDDNDACAIVAAVIVLAHSLRLEVVAEGVETETQLHFLQQQQCDILQGYYLSRPVPAKQLTKEFMEKGHFIASEL